MRSLPTEFAIDRRAGFTLVEILVTVAIIAILLSLTAAGVFQVIAAQRGSNTQNTMKGVNIMLKQQMKSVWEKANNEPVPLNVLNNLAGGDARRARLIWRKLRLKQEFPMTFAEAMYPYLTFADVNTPTPPGWVTTSTPAQWAIFNPSTGVFNPMPTVTFPTVASGLVYSDLPPKGSYVKALKNVKYANVAGTPTVTGRQFIESSTCLLLALQEKRDGISLNIDELGSAAVDLNGDGLKELVDGWNNPIAFFRFPTGNNAVDSTNPAGPPAAGVTAANFRDPYDPEGLLLNAAWNPNANFQALCHMVYTPNAKYMTPVLVSPGPDGKFGIDSLFYPKASPQVGVNPDMNVHPSPSDSDDNIFSYLLQ